MDYFTLETVTENKWIAGRGNYTNIPGGVLFAHSKAKEAKVSVTIRLFSYLFKSVLIQLTLSGHILKSLINL